MGIKYYHRIYSKKFLNNKIILLFMDIPKTIFSASLRRKIKSILKNQQCLSNHIQPTFAHQFTALLSTRTSNYWPLSWKIYQILMLATASIENPFIMQLFWKIPKHFKFWLSMELILRIWIKERWHLWC